MRKNCSRKPGEYFLKNSRKSWLDDKIRAAERKLSLGNYRTPRPPLVATDYSVCTTLVRNVSHFSLFLAKPSYYSSSMEHCPRYRRAHLLRTQSFASKSPPLFPFTFVHQIASESDSLDQDPLSFLTKLRAWACTCKYRVSQKFLPAVFF